MHISELAITLRTMRVLAHYMHGNSKLIQYAIFATPKRTLHVLYMYVNYRARKELIAQSAQQQCPFRVAPTPNLAPLDSVNFVSAWPLIDDWSKSDPSISWRLQKLRTLVLQVAASKGVEYRWELYPAHRKFVQLT